MKRTKMELTEGIVSLSSCCLGDDLFETFHVLILVWSVGPLLLELLGHGFIDVFEASKCSCTEVPLSWFPDWRLAFGDFLLCESASSWPTSTPSANMFLLLVLFLVCLLMTGRAAGTLCSFHFLLCASHGVENDYTAD